MLAKPVIIPLCFATLAAFCSTSASPLNGCGWGMEERIEQKAAKIAKGEDKIEFASGGWCVSPIQSFEQKAAQ